MFAKIRIFNHTACRARWGRAGVKVTETMICAGGRRDACDGDSGGPLTCMNKLPGRPVQHYLCGIVSWGAHCLTRSKRFAPGVYTDIRKYAEWTGKQMNSWGKHDNDEYLRAQRRTNIETSVKLFVW